MSEHPELRKGRRCLFIPSNDNNAGKELNGASISRWICTTIVDSHASIQSSKNIPGKVKAHEVHAVATSLKLFNKVDLQAVMKAGRWSSGGPFTSYLQDLCSQADSTEDRTSRSRRRDRGNFLLGELYYVYFVSSGSYIPLSLVLPFEKRGGVCPGGPTEISDSLSLSVRSWIMVSPEPVLADALPYLLYSGIIRNVIRIICNRIEVSG